MLAVGDRDHRDVAIFLLPIRKKRLGIKWRERKKGSEKKWQNFYGLTKYSFESAKLS